MISHSEILKRIKVNLHDSFKEFRLKWRVPNSKEVGFPVYIWNEFHGLELYKNNGKRISLVFTNELNSIIKQYITQSIFDFVESEEKFARFLAVLHKDLTKNELMMMTLRESDKSILNALAIRLAPYVDEVENEC